MSSARHSKISQEISVSFSYEVIFTHGALHPENPSLREAVSRIEPGRCHRLLFVVEQVLLKHYPELLDDISRYCDAHRDALIVAGRPAVISGGEKLKSFGVVADLCSLFDRHHLDRQSFVCIIGGGAFLDAVGLAASIVHRGIRQLRFPTTVLSQNDSGVGVKNGINMFDKKNYLGCFAPPFAVINDFNFLSSLDYRDWISGIAEAFKVAMIKDADFFVWLCEHSEELAECSMAAMEHLIIRCAELHLEHIRTSGDPFEFGSARPLDFGHWAAHKLEMLSGGALRHGEAVAIGVLLDARYAYCCGMLPVDVFDRLLASFRKLGFAIWIEELEERDEEGELLLLKGLEEFREHLGGDLHITLPDGLGKKLEVQTLDKKLIIENIEWLREHA